MPQLPGLFLESIACCPGYDEAALIRAHEQELPVSIRLNPFKPSKPDIAFKAGVPWCNGGHYLQQRPQFTYDPLFQAGCYYVQEAGSMFLDHIIRHTIDLSAPIRALDLCAAPGGKSTLALSLLNNDSVLVSNEVIKSRADILVQNLGKWGRCNTIVTNNDPKDFTDLGEVFDLVIVDAPCSGSGLFRKQEDAIAEWSLDNVNLCAQRQKRILADVLPSLKEGGTLIYSTCSYSQEENEAIVSWLVQEQGLETIAIPVDPAWGIVHSDCSNAGLGYRFYPYNTASEGFFCAVLRKGEAGSSGQGRSKKPYLEPATKKELAAVSRWVGLGPEQAVLRFKDDLLLVNTAVRDLVNLVQNKLYYKKVGLKLGSVIKDELVPHHELALSTDLLPTVPRIEADREMALHFMRKESFMPEGAKGWNLLSYEGHGLGWLKKLDNRINNYLPNEFKIVH